MNQKSKLFLFAICASFCSFRLLAGYISVAEAGTRILLPEVSEGGISAARHTVLSDGVNLLKLFHGLRRAEYNDRVIWLNAPVLADYGAPAKIDKSDVVKFLQPIVNPSKSTNRLFRVHLDAGHGGHDGGCASPFSGLLEKDIALDITLRVGDILKLRGYMISYTRVDDTFFSLGDRGALAAAAAAHAFVSIHMNSARNSSARGAECYILPLAGYESTADGTSSGACSGDKYAPLNASLGYSIHCRLPGRTGEDDRGLRHARYQVLRQATCPAVLVECGFLSNRSDSRNLGSNWYLDRIAAGIADGVTEFFSRHVGSVSR